MKNKNYENKESKTFTVKDLPLTERPRERLEKYGADNMLDSELLAIILRTGFKGKTVMQLGQELMARYDTLEGLANASIAELKQTKGIGKAKAIELTACIEIARRILDGKRKEEDRINNSDTITSPDRVLQAIANDMRKKIDDETKEHFFVVSFNTRNKYLGLDKISTGSMTASVVHPRETFGAAIRRHAASIIIAHNHPSGEAEPSDEDLKITRRLIEAGKIVGIEVLDHIIITKNKHLSFKEKGLI
jgi:DNA repair protein RadC